MDKMEGKMNKMEKNSSERLLKQLIAALKLEGNQMPGGVLESDDYNIIIIKLIKAITTGECRRKAE